MDVLVGTNIRPATKADFTAVLNIITTQFTTDFQGMTFTAEDLEERWQGLALETDTWLALKGETAVAYLDLMAERTMPMLFLAADIYAEVGRQLLRLAEESVTSDSFFMTQISQKNLALQKIYEQAGYQRGLTFSNMEIILRSPPHLPVLPNGFEIRPYNPTKDAHATYLADEEASQDKGYHTPLSFADWQTRMRLNREDFDPAWWFLAWAEDDIAAVCLCLTRADQTVAWIDHLGVRRPYRRQGLGKALLLNAFAQFYQRGILTVMLNVDSDSLTNAPHLYESVGMKTVQAYHIYRKKKIGYSVTSD